MISVSLDPTAITNKNASFSMMREHHHLYLHLSSTNLWTKLSVNLELVVKDSQKENATLNTVLTTILYRLKGQAELIIVLKCLVSLEISVSFISKESVLTSINLVKKALSQTQVHFQYVNQVFNHNLLLLSLKFIHLLKHLFWINFVQTFFQTAIVLNLVPKVTVYLFLTQ